MELRIQRNGSTLIKRVISTNHNNGLKQKTKEIKDDMGIDEEDLAGS